MLSDGCNYRMITVYDWNGYALDEGDEIAEGLSTFLDREVRLFRFITDDRAAEQHPGMKIPRMVDSSFSYGHETTFTDGFPYLIINEVRRLFLSAHPTSSAQASYEDLRRRVETDFEIDR